MRIGTQNRIKMAMDFAKKKYQLAGIAEESKQSRRMIKIYVIVQSLCQHEGDEDLLVAAWLPTLFQYTDTTYYDLKKAFGADVADIALDAYQNFETYTLCQKVEAEIITKAAGLANLYFAIPREQQETNENLA